MMSAAKEGEAFESVELDHSGLGDEIFAGLYVCSHNDTVTESAVFSNVRVIRPAPENFTPYRDYIGSHIEILDVESGRSEIVYSSEEPLQAPNWTIDGKALIYNNSGILYRFNLAGKKIEPIESGFATNQNNDHVLSFDGKLIGLSHHPPEENYRSVIYIIPSVGGAPNRVTALGPSYLHGWSPDGKYLVYTGERNGEFDIYKIPFTGGEEIRMTNAPGLDDGPEYTPDGQFIYFNSARSGWMQIWRMRPDGNDQNQVTHDSLNNWFPHISPDGQWIVFLSYLPDVKPADHPYYRQVYIRLMPVSGCPVRIITYVYGGQGTINVPSWSPDSKKIAFISNSRMR